MKCFNCKGKTKKFLFNSVLLDKCIQCSSIWVDNGQLSLLQNSQRSSSKQMRLEAIEKITDSIIMNTCQKCGNKLTQFTKNKVEIDFCEKCGGLGFNQYQLEIFLKNNKNVSFLNWIKNLFK